MVLIVGGVDANYNLLSGAEIYNPAASSFNPTGSLNAGRENHTATLLNNGMVLITGGDDKIITCLEALSFITQSPGFSAPSRA